MSKDELLKFKKRLSDLYSISVLATVIFSIIAIWSFSLGLKLLLTSLIFNIFFWIIKEACENIEVKDDDE